MPVLKYKNASGNFVALTNYAVQPITPVQTTGSSTTDIMSQNATTVALSTKANASEVYTKTNIDSLIADYFDGAEYTDGTGTMSGKKVIAFKHGNSIKVQVDATPFLKDGMLSNAEIKNATVSGETVKCLVLTFNTDAGSSSINVPISDIFNADNYVAKSEIDNIVADSISDAFDAQSPTQAQSDLKDAISEAVAKAVEEALADTSGTTPAIITQIENVVSDYTVNGVSVDDALTNSHSHSNKAVLDTITSEKVTAWDNASSGGVTNVAYDTTNKKLTKTVGGSTSDVVTAAKIVEDGGGITSLPTGSVTGTAGAGKTLTAFSQTNGQVSATFGNISITKSQVSDLGTIGVAAEKAVDSSIAAGSTSANLPTSAAVASFVEGKGYTTNEGTVTGVTIDGSSTGITTTDGVVNLPAYPTTLPASDVSAWAKAASKPSYALTEITGADDVKAIEALTGTSGLLKKTAANTWALDTDSYLKGTTSVQSITGDTTATASPASGAQAHIIYRNTGNSNVTVTVAHGSYVTSDGADITLSVAAGGYCEVNFMNIKGTIFARGL